MTVSRLIAAPASVHSTRTVDAGHSPWRWGTGAFLLALLIEGMPLGRELAPSEILYAAQLHTLALEQATTIGLEKTWVVALLWGGLYLVAAITVMLHGRNELHRLFRKQWPLLFLLLVVPASCLWTTHIAPVLMNSVHAFGCALLALCAAVYYRGRIDICMRHLALVFGLNVSLHVGSVVLMHHLAIDYSGRWRGLTTNANTLGALAFCAFWASVACLVLYKSAARKRYIFFCIVAIIALGGSGSATSMIAALLSGALIAILGIPRISWRPLMPFLVCFVVAIAALVIAYMDDLLQIVVSLADKDITLSGRTLIWPMALHVISQRPWLGWGFDNDATVIELTGLSTVHFHNGYLDLMTRGGLLALTLLLVVCFCNVLWSIKGRNIAIVSFLAAFLLYNITEVTFLASRNGMWLIFLFFYFFMKTTYRSRYSITA